MFEICQKGAGGDPNGVFDSLEDDCYDSDEEYPQADNEMRMKVSSKLDKDFQEPVVERVGGVFWEMMDGLKSNTKFTNSEITHESM